MRRLTRCCAQLAVALTLAGAPAVAAEDMAAKFKVGDTAPDFELAEIGGGQVRLSAFAGDKVVLLNFWSLRCGACLEEVPHLNRIHRDLGGRDVAVISVLTDGVDAAATRTIMKEVGAAPAYRVLVDPDFAVSDAYTNFLVPHTLVIDRKGVIRYVHTGFEAGTEKQYVAALDRALGL
jgi:peroxiredoxin